MLKKCSYLTCLTTALCGSVVQAEDVYFDLSGNLSVEQRFFTEDLSSENPAGQYDSNLSVALEPEFYWEWNGGKDSLLFTPYLRVDEHDSERTHADIRELSWIHVGNNWEIRTGLRRVFWGVTEFQHLVDVINQFDTVDDIDSEDKLGQPMVNLSYITNVGIFDLFVLPGFRERTFAGEGGRLRGPLIVDTDEASYESAAEDKHTDLALRWAHSIGYFDIGAYIFEGTNREPQLRLSSVSGEARLTPFYEQMTQVGVDVQATTEGWLWKFESIVRHTREDTFTAVQGGFEYTFYGLFESATDLGLLMEHGWDDRGENATSTFQNDTALGLRLSLNDEASTELLAGFVHDFDYNSQSFVVEGSRRFGNRLRITLDGRIFSASDQQDALSVFDNNDHIQLKAELYF